MYECLFTITIVLGGCSSSLPLGIE